MGLVSIPAEGGGCDGVDGAAAAAVGTATEEGSEVMAPKPAAAGGSVAAEAGVCGAATVAAAAVAPEEGGEGKATVLAAAAGSVPVEAGVCGAAKIAEAAVAPEEVSEDEAGGSVLMGNGGCDGRVDAAGSAPSAAVQPPPPVTLTVNVADLTAPAAAANPRLGTSSETVNSASFELAPVEAPLLLASGAALVVDSDGFQPVSTEGVEGVGAAGVLPESAVSEVHQASLLCRLLEQSLQMAKS